MGTVIRLATADEINAIFQICTAVVQVSGTLCDDVRYQKHTVQ
ncbi:hypothetical protein RGV33_20425 [Pseudomonas sp. Bout1]|nr:hypothetical protein [Pseudomonas sp. Bout1]MDY7534014.1 hypothetical protein [Pseudomonas sp. Bout1]MEB0189050.1 hypothetical protein [Pseudomonas sp. Bout1]